LLAQWREESLDEAGLDYEGKSVVAAPPLESVTNGVDENLLEVEVVAIY
jgi:hypothetical protein